MTSDCPVDVPRCTACGGRVGNDGGIDVDHNGPICKDCMIERWWSGKPYVFPKPFLGPTKKHMHFSTWEDLFNLIPETRECELVGPLLHMCVDEEDYYYVLKKPDGFAVCDLHGIKESDIKKFPKKQKEWKYKSKKLKELEQEQKDRIRQTTD